MKTIIKAPPRRNPAPTGRPESTTTRLRAYTLGQYFLFVMASYGLFFALCATGRAGA